MEVDEKLEVALTRPNWRDKRLRGSESCPLKGVCHRNEIYTGLTKNLVYLWECNEDNSGSWSTSYK